MAKRSSRACSSRGVPCSRSRAAPGCVVVRRPRGNGGCRVHDVEVRPRRAQRPPRRPDGRAGQVLATREELCASKPSPLLLTGYATALADDVAGVPEVAAPVRHLRTVLKRFAG